MSYKRLREYRATKDFLIPIDGECEALYTEMMPMRTKFATSMAFKNGVRAGLAYQRCGAKIPRLYEPGSCDDIEFRSGARAGSLKARETSASLEVAA